MQDRELLEAVNKVNATIRPATAEAISADEERQRRTAIGRCVSVLRGDLGERYSPDRVNLTAFQVYHEAQRKAIVRLKQFCLPGANGFSDFPGLIFFGTVGTGKDHLMAAMLYTAAYSGVSCRWINGQELFGQFRDRMDTGQREEDLLRVLCEPKILGISDPIPPVGDPSAWNTSQLYRLLDRRYRSLKKTWCSLNALSTEEADGKLSAPVFDRLREGAEIFPCFWPSWRERKQTPSPVKG